MTNFTWYVLKKRANNLPVVWGTTVRNLHVHLLKSPSNYQGKWCVKCSLWGERRNIREVGSVINTSLSDAQTSALTLVAAELERCVNQFL